MHDTTCVPALVDIAAMRDAVAEAGGDPRRLSPMLPVDVSVDHSVGVDHYGVLDAFAHNMQREVERNGERYRFMKWASQALDGVRVHPPGTGIMHTINLEQLTSVAKIEVVDGIEWAIPDTLVGTDSHTPMVNALSVLAWGVGGLEAESVMLGMPIELRVPNVVGVRLTGRLREGGDGNRPRAAGNPSIAQARCFRRVRRVFRAGRIDAQRRRACRRGQYGAGIRCLIGFSPRMSAPSSTSPRSAERPKASGLVEGLCEGAGPVVRAGCRTALHLHREH